jgi:hypothetical protein
MNIIIGETDLSSITDKYVVLELDTFKGQDQQTVKSFALIENLPLTEMHTAIAYADIHKAMMSDYRDMKWDQCIGALDLLEGRWNREIDTFYQDLRQRVEHYKLNEPESTWTGVRVRV